MTPGVLLLLLACFRFPEADFAADPEHDFDGDGVTEREGDCDDLDEAISPGASELCNLVDDDCDGEVDEEAVDATTWFRDADGDARGDPAVTQLSCWAAEGWTTDDADCDDSDPEVHPGAEETWYDGVDADCDGASDDDADGDGHDVDTDCDDTLPEVNPDAEEICYDGLDNDCDGVPEGCTWAGHVSLRDADVTFVGSYENEATGTAVAAVGDIDQDGSDDFVLGTAAGGAVDSEVAVAAWLVHGAAEMETVVHLGDAHEDIVFFQGATAVDLAGRSLMGPGDVDADGVPDLIIGAQGADGRAPNAGGFYLVHGPTTGGLLTEAGLVARSAMADEHLGYAMAAPGDILGDDGHADLLVSGIGAYDGQGAVYVIDGFSLGRLELNDAFFDLGPTAWVGETDDHAGASVDMSPDVDGDGLPELLVGASQDAGETGATGRAYVVDGEIVPRGGLLASDAVAFRGVEAGGDAGRRVAAAGDLDGDGYADVAIGDTEASAGYERQGAVFFVLGGGDFFETYAGEESALSTAAEITVYGATEGNQLGATIVGDHDFDADGRADVLVSAPGWDGDGTSNAGIVYLVSGGELQLAGNEVEDVATASLAGVSSTDLAGRQLAVIDDLDGDGRASLLVAASGLDSDDGSNVGGAYLIRMAGEL